MASLIFNAADVKRVVEHSIAAPKQGSKFTYKNGKAGSETPTEPSVILVHDQGVYLMSNGEPRDIVEGESSFVAYANGTNPKTAGEWWDNARALVGGDDFGETLPWARDMLAEIEGGAKTITVKVTATTMELVKKHSKAATKTEGLDASEKKRLTKLSATKTIFVLEGDTGGYRTLKANINASGVRTFLSKMIGPEGKYAGKKMKVFEPKTREFVDVH